MVQYGVLKGTIELFKRSEDIQGHGPHFNLKVATPGEAWRCPVNVQSSDGSEIWVKIEPNLTGHPVLDRLEGLAPGLIQLPDRQSGLTLDFIREPMFDRGLMKQFPMRSPGPGNDAQDFLEAMVTQAQAGQSSIYVFGSFWRNQQFPADHDPAFQTHQGVHDVHMNQGNRGHFAVDDGVFQDGAVLFHSPVNGWSGFFVAFDSQVWFTSDTDGHRVPGFPEGPLAHLPDHPTAPVTAGFDEAPPALTLIAALVNPVGPDPGNETITLFNAGAETISLAGWKVMDRSGRADTLADQRLEPNSAATIRLSGAGATLGNSGGTIRLVSPAGITVQAVTYSAERAARPGRIVTF